MAVKKIIQIYFICLTISISSLSQAAPIEAPGIKLPTATGEFELQTLRGKVVLLDFWASWCKPCVKSFPWMQQMQERYRNQGLEVVAINLDQEQKLAQDFVAKMQTSFTVAFDASGTSAKAYQLFGMPTSYLIGRDGLIYASHIGFREKDKAKLEKAIQELLNQ